MAREWTEREANGVVRHVRIDDDGLITERLVHDAEPVLERNKALANHNDGWTASREMRRVASIPMGVVLAWKHIDGIDVFNPDHAEAVKRKLNDPDWRYLRNAEGTL